MTNREHQTLMVAALLLSSGCAMAENSPPNWAVRSGNGPCALESAAIPVNDGYLDISVQLRFSRDGLRGITPSTIDPEGDHLGLRVDDKVVTTRVAIEGQTDVRLEGDIDEIATRFQRGGEAELSLRFWPSWPVTGTQAVKFSLKGFTAAWKQYQQCL